MGGDELKPSSHGTNVSEIFDTCCAFYMSIGMTYEEYWNGDSSLPIYYRKAYKLKQESANHEAWLYGLYVYDAVSSALTLFNSKESSRKSYTPKPFSFSGKEVEEEKKVEAEAQAEVWMKSCVSATQKMFDKK